MKIRVKIPFAFRDGIVHEIGEELSVSAKEAESISGLYEPVVEVKKRRDKRKLDAVVKAESANDNDGV